jgi:hypothetical protein
MISRRKFTFAVVLATVSGPALAQAPAEPGFTARYLVSLEGDGALNVRLFLTSTRAESVSIVRLRGSQPGPHLQAQRVGAKDRTELERIPVQDPNELHTRAGPLKGYVSLAPGVELEMAPYRFVVRGAVHSVALSLVVELASRESVALPEQIVTVEKA